MIKKQAVREVIVQRNRLFSLLRDFFSERNVLEVDTSLLRKFSVTDPYMNAFSVSSSCGQHQGYLQTSPEYAMKQLICGGSGDIFQLSKMFRAEENGNHHACEFTLLEWYRLGFDHFQLMNEVSELIICAVGEREVVKKKYRDIFLQVLSFDPFNISLDELSILARKQLGDIPKDLLFDNYLSLLFSEIIEPSFDLSKITIIYGYPESQASLAKIREDIGFNTADRFEVYLEGMELANGFNELTDAKRQLQRFKNDNEIRRELGLQPIEIDHDFISALDSGMPSCAGVALGFDRLLMIQTGQPNIKSVLIE